NDLTHANGNANWDLDWVGSSGSPADIDLFQPHYSGRHHAPRHLKVPNGGESYNGGGTIPCSWAAGGGAHSRVTLGLRRDGNLGAVTFSSSLADDGSESWTIPGSIVAGADYRVRLIHSVDDWDHSSNYGVDSSDAVFTIRPDRIVDLSTPLIGKTIVTLEW